MFYGHIAVALAAKPLAPKVSLGVMLVAVSAIDILCGVFSALKIEGMGTAGGASSIPWSHGLFMAVVWSVAGFAISYFVTKNVKASIVVGALIFSHWILDFISHPMGMGKPAPKDLSLLFEGSPKVGLGLYNSAAGAMITEFGTIIAAIVFYLKRTKAKDRTGIWAFVCLIVFLALFPLFMGLPRHLMYLATFSTIPMLPLGIWIDRHRTIV